MMLRSLATSSLAAVLLLTAACATEEPAAGGEDAQINSTIMAAQIPADRQQGEAAFNTNCASCHGDRGLGTDQGPPLIHIIYEPSHHADVAFIVAAQRGVRAHHWAFGDMPPLPNLAHEELVQIIAYIRFLQQQVGIS